MNIQVHRFKVQILLKESNYEKKCVGGKKYDDCGNLTKFQNKYRIDINDQSLSNMKVKWKRYEYIDTSIQGANSVKKIELLEDEIFLIDFLRKFEAKILHQAFPQSSMARLSIQKIS